MTSNKKLQFYHFENKCQSVNILVKTVKFLNNEESGTFFVTAENYM